MPDIADSANDTVEIELAASLSVQRKAAEKLSQQRREHEERNLAAGVCLNCRDSIEKGTLYCPPLDGQGKSECQQDHERRLGTRRQQTWA
jgi:cytochrome c553